MYPHIIIPLFDAQQIIEYIYKFGIFYTMILHIIGTAAVRGIVIFFVMGSVGQLSLKTISSLN